MEGSDEIRREERGKRRVERVLLYYFTILLLN